MPYVVLRMQNITHDPVFWPRLKTLCETLYYSGVMRIPETMAQELFGLPEPSKTSVRTNHHHGLAQPMTGPPPQPIKPVADYGRNPECVTGNVGHQRRARRALGGRQ